MDLEGLPISSAAYVNPFGAADITAILRDRGWALREILPAQNVWCERAAFLLGPQADDHNALASLLRLVFEYDAACAMKSIEAHAVMSRYAARNVIRLLARLALQGGPCTEERFKDIVTALKEGLGLRGREVLHPLRLALIGQTGSGELDRVILLLDSAAEAGLPVKTVRQRMIEFCSVLD